MDHPTPSIDLPIPNLSDELTRLPERERRIVELRFGLDSERTRSTQSARSSG